jgi:hypothetical protein
VIVLEKTPVYVSVPIPIPVSVQIKIFPTNFVLGSEKNKFYPGTAIEDTTKKG